MTRSVQIVLSFLVQVLAWGETPSLEQSCGAILVILAILASTMDKSILQLCGCSNYKENNDNITKYAAKEEQQTLLSDSEDEIVTITDSNLDSPQLKNKCNFD